ncbi:MAG: PadR family transcriptional regulator [Anaerolineae bacterium]|nr:PadR family transcriptional regulator [Anaerolineae bacterium]
MPLRDQIRKGSSETLILNLLAEEPMYGYQMTRELKRRSSGYFHMKEGLLYPTLHRMEQEGLIVSEWRTGTGRRRRKYYCITDKGRQALARQTVEWRTFAERLLRLLDMSTEAAETA